MSNTALKPCSDKTYLRNAPRAAKAAPDGVISAGQVAYLSHRRRITPADADHVEDVLDASPNWMLVGMMTKHFGLYKHISNMVL